MAAHGALDLARGCGRRPPGGLLPHAYLRQCGRDVIFQLWVGKQLESRCQGLHEVWLSLILPHVLHASHL